ncbi:hypothetical protein D3P09_16775 [Paenibacillus pinisoli]|uniref:Uncharacterized protein n=1 Tax=Paenibacillus pinisoli TaxID=1276110 RepID=A0A3A6PHD1_9BACL|nr:hypothetical protein [Paenibacillus pinisoli]RJX39146.1 hypothetical protein D3P09_16775 [Paenibacillus pinisoli]
MDNEVGNSIHIMINLIVIAAVIGMITFFTNLGQAFSREQLDKTANLTKAVYSSDLILAAAHGPVPAASVYVLLQRNEQVIEFQPSYIYSKWITKPEDLMPLFDRKIRMKVHDDDEDGIYYVELREENDTRA